MISFAPIISAWSRANLAVLRSSEWSISRNSPASLIVCDCCRLVARKGPPLIARDCRTVSPERNLYSPRRGYVSDDIDRRVFENFDGDCRCLNQSDFFLQALGNLVREAGVIAIADGNGSKKGQKDSAFIRDGIFAAKRIPSFILAFGLHPLDNRQTDFRLRSQGRRIGESRRHSSGKKDECTDDKRRREKTR